MNRTSFRQNPDNYPSNLIEIFGAINECNEEVAIDYIQQYLRIAQEKTKNSMSEDLPKTAMKNIMNGRFDEAKRNLIQFDELLCTTIKGGGFFST
ncbi:hypothetical protein P4B35_03130 [Pontiellaceae bacterium B12227]|nr:hypothetical protein [Pontiellaceae bacterium B12227]